MQPPDYVFNTDRLAALASYAILDTPAEPGFDDIVHLAAQVCEAPVALVSLVAEDRQWFKARVGFAPCESDLNSSVCAHALLEPDLLVIPDLTQDARSATNPLVIGDPHIRFYAGAPFRGSSGEVLGSLCVIDTMARAGGLTGVQASALRVLARQVTGQLDLRKAIAERDLLLAQQHDAAARRQALLLLGDRLRALTTSADMTRVTSQIVGQTLDVSRAGFSLVNEEGGYLLSDPDWTADSENAEARHAANEQVMLWDGLLRGEPLVVRDVLTDPRMAQRVAFLSDLGTRALVNMPVREHSRTVAVFVVHDRNPREWPPEVLAFLRNVADRLEAGIARLRAEAEQRVLNHELSHRLKNTFAMIQAIAKQTLRSVSDQEPVEAFTQRLLALSAAHDVLLQQKWTAAKLGDVARSVIKTLVELARFDISGPEVDLGPRATLSCSLLLHELTTNALKYGSLSTEKGRVALNWQIDRSDAEAKLSLNWRESGGPTVVEPSRKGFGTRLIRMGLLGTGGVELRYLTSGLSAEFKAPLAQVQLSQGGGSEQFERREDCHPGCRR